MPRRARYGLAVALGVSVCAGPALARELVLMNDWGGPMADPVSAGRASGFSVAAGVTELADTPAPAVFDAMAAGDWQTVIRLLETLGEGESTTLIRDNTGMLRPLSTLKAQVMAELPAEGRRTFRMMYRPQAEKLLADAASITDPAQQALVYHQVMERYALCAAAAHAAERLGDLHFEAGRFGESTRCYALAAGHADGDPDDAGLLAKRLLALARGGDWTGFETLADYARFRRADTEVRIAGEDRPLADWIDQLAQQRAAQPDVPVHAGRPLLVPRAGYPSVRIQAVDPGLSQLIQQSMANQRVAVSPQSLTQPAVLAADGRVYTLVMGQLTATATQTGETLWTVGDAGQAAQQVGNWAYQLAQGYQQSISMEGDTLLAIAHDPEQMDTARLTAYDKATGAVRWTSRAGTLAQHSFLGETATRDETVYAIAKERSGNRLLLYALGLDDGADAWSLELGQAAIDPNWRQAVGLVPRVVVGERYIFVLTNNGALIAVDPVRREVAWAMTYGVISAGNPYGGSMGPTTTGDIAVQDGVVLSKDTRDDRLVAIRASDAVVLWTTQVDPAATLVHGDDRHAYLLGEELVAIDLRTGERVWWTRHHGDTDQPPAFTSTHALIAGPRRMCRIDLTTGKVDGYRDDLPTGTHGSEVIQLDRGVALVGAQGVLIYDTDPDD